MINNLKSQGPNDTAKKKVGHYAHDNIIISFRPDNQHTKELIDAGKTSHRQQ